MVLREMLGNNVPIRFASCSIENDTSKVKSHAQLPQISLSDYTHSGFVPGQCSHVEAGFHLL